MHYGKDHPTKKKLGEMYILLIHNVNEPFLIDDSLMCRLRYFRKCTLTFGGSGHTVVTSNGSYHTVSIHNKTTAFIRHLFPNRIVTGVY